MDYTFTNFVVGTSNHFAHTAALAVAHAPAVSYNPLLLHGGPGLGKTHLLHAIAHHLHQCHPTWRVVCLSADHFMRDLQQALQHERLQAFHTRYRQADALLLDNVHSLAGRAQTQEILLYTLEALCETQKQIVFSSALPPHDITPMVPRLRSRLLAGLTVDVQPPDLETRLTILTRKAATYGMPLPPDVALALATHASEHVRALEQCFTRLVTYASLHAQPLTRALVEHIIQDADTARQQPPTIAQIQHAVAAHCAVTVRALCAKQRQRSLVLPRQLAMFLCRELTEVSLREIGDAFGGRDHSTILYACAKVTRLEETDESVAGLLWELRQEFLA